MDYTGYNSNVFTNGSVNLSNNVKIKNSNAMTVEEGWDGVVVSGGQISWEYNTKLTDPITRYNTYQEMRSDATVDTALNLVELPFKSARAHIQPASTDPTDQMIARFINDQLIDTSTFNSSYSFLQHCREASKMLQFGVMPFEIVQYRGDWIDSDGKLYKKMNLLKKLAVRFPNSIKKWVFDATNSNGLDAIEQYSVQGDISKDFKGSLTIPIEKMIIYTNDKIGSNWEGTSILRPAYKHWYFKNSFYKVEGIGIQKNALSTPVLYLNYPSEASLLKGRKILRSYGASEETGTMLQEGKERLEMLNSGITTSAIQGAINHHDSKILQTVFGGFMLLGQESRGGARNLGSSLIELFMMQVDSTLALLCDYINRYLIPKIVNTNFSNVVKYPKMYATSDRVTDRLTMAMIAKILVETSLISSDDTKTKQWVKDTFNVPTTDGFYENTISKKTTNKTKSEKAQKDIAVKNSFYEKFNDSIYSVDKLETENLSEQIKQCISIGVVPTLSVLETKYNKMYENLYNDYKNNIECSESISCLVNQKLNNLKLDLLSTCFE